jgi:4-hydroxyphenylacetate 3-monooxygenase
MAGIRRFLPNALHANGDRRGRADAMALNPLPAADNTLLPNGQAAESYRVFSGDAYSRINEIVQKIVASALIYLPSSARDFKNPSMDRLLARFVRGSNGVEYRDRIKIMKLLCDAIGTEFGGRHELYEINYAGNHEHKRIQALGAARGSGALDGMLRFVDQCMADYDENGWTNRVWVNPDDLAGTPAAADSYRVRCDRDQAMRTPIRTH